MSMVVEAHPFLKMDRDALHALMDEDAQRLAHAAEELQHAVDHARTLDALWSDPKPEERSAADRAAMRAAWWGVVEPLMEVEGIKHRYKGWFAANYVLHATVHARAYARTYASLCAEVAGGQTFMALVQNNPRAQVVLDEAVPEAGLPQGVFATLREKLARTRHLSYVPVGAAWWTAWIHPRLQQQGLDAQLKALVGRWRDRALAVLDAGALPRAVSNHAQMLAHDAFAAWLPIQTEFSAFAGDVRFVPEDRRLITDAQVAELRTRLLPGDILVERRNWYLSNVGLPGFWPHSVLYAGTPAEISAALDADPQVQQAYGVFSQAMAKSHPEAWSALGAKDGEGHVQVTLEAVGAGVLSRSLEHSAGADYAAAMRPRLPPLEVAYALDQALSFFGRPYDFDFDFATDDRLVCSEFVMKSYRAGKGRTGLTVPFSNVAGRNVVAPTDMVKAFARERGQPDRQFDFVAFLEGLETRNAAHWADEEAFAASANRPKWDLAQH